MSAVLAPDPAGAEVPRIALASLGTLTPVGRAGGQGRVYRPERPLATAPTVVKLYRRAPPASAVDALADMIAFSHGLPAAQRARLHGLTAWPLAIVTGAQEAPAGIVMRDLSPRFTVPFVMPSGRRQDVLLSLEHLLGDDRYLLARGLDVTLGTVLRLRVAERISSALGFLHDLGVVVSDIAPNNLLVSFGRSGPPVSFIDCDSMVLRGRQALPAVQTTDWQLPSAFGEAPGTRGGDAYKLGLIVLRLLARSHDARELWSERRHVPEALREPLSRALGPEASLRPSPGEWERMLHTVATTSGIASLYPGPPPRPLARPAPAPPPAPVPLWGAGRGAPGRPGRPGAGWSAPSAGRPSAPSQWGAPRRRGLPGVAIAWVLVGTVIFMLLLAQLFAAAIPQQTSQFSSPGNGAGQGPVVIVPSNQGDFGNGNGP